MSQAWRTKKPGGDEYAPYYASYIEEAPAADLIDTMETQNREIPAMLLEVPEARGGFRYADGKWTLREVVQHLNDAERVFGFRLLWFARNSGTDLPGFDENRWVPEGDAERRALAELAAEFSAIRKSTIAMIKLMTDDQMRRRGTASGNQFSCQALAWIMAGHVTHHARVLRERYLVPPVQAKPPAAATPG